MPDVVPWHARTPFLVKLRLCPEGVLPAPKDLPKLIARAAGEPPEDWVRARLLDGRALVLLDGIDEVPDARRRDIRESIADYFGTFPKSQFVVTSRPAAVSDPAWAELFGPSRVAVQPMAPVDIEAFVEQWHEALAAKLRAAVDRRAVDRLPARSLPRAGSGSSLRRHCSARRSATCTASAGPAAAPAQRALPRAVRPADPPPRRDAVREGGAGGG